MSLKTYKVTGVAFIPIQVEKTLRARDEKHAKAQVAKQWESRVLRDLMIVPNSDDYSAAFDFQPSEAIEQ